MDSAEPGGGLAATTTTSTAAAATTTISTIVLNSKPIQLVIAMLQSGDVYHIKVVDIAPKITFLGANIDEAVHLQKQHDIVFKQLQLQTSPIDEFAPKAAELLRSRNAPAQVLAAMGDSLQLVWTDVLDLLKRRKHIIDSNANLHEKIAVCTGKMSALEVACRDTMIPIEIESVQEFLNKFKQLRIEVLAAVMVALKEGNELLSCLRALANAGTLDTRPDHIRGEVKRSLTQVEVWLEQLHDRRNVLELAWQTRKVQLEQCLALAIFAKELHDLETALHNRKNAVQGVPNLGDSEAGAHLLHEQYVQHKAEALALRDKALKITRATEKLVASGCFAGDEACAKAYNVLSGCTEFLDVVDHTEHALAMAREFFAKGERALGVLEKLEVEVSSARHAAGSAEALSIHTQVLQEIGELTQEPLRLGYSILNDVGRSNAQVSGIERVIEEIENRKQYLVDLCSASSEKCVHITETLTMFMERHNNILSWLVSIAEAFLRKTNDLGTDLKSSTAFLKVHHQLMSDLEIKGTDINNLLVSVTEILGEIEGEQRHDIDQKVEALHSHWTQLKDLIEGRVDLVTVYVQFLQLAESLSNMFDYIEQMLRESPEQDRLAQLDAVWTKVKPAYEQLKSEGARFLDETSKVADPYLETKSACNRVDEILTGFSSRQFDITESWESWTHRIVEQRETELLWEQTMTENVQSMNSASKLDAQLYPVLTAAPTDDCAELRRFLVDKQNTVCDEINRAHLEIQHRIESTQSLNPRDEQTREKVRTVLENLHGIQQKLQSVGNGYRTLLDSLLNYVQNIGDTRTEIERYFREQFPSVSAELVDEVARSHEQFRERIMSRFRALIVQSEQIIERVRGQEPPGAKDHDTDRILSLLERLRAAFETQNGERAQELRQQQDVGRFTKDLREVHSSLDDVARQLGETLAQPADTLGAATATHGAFQYFEKTIELLETRVSNFTVNAERTIAAAYPGTQSNVNAELQKLTTRWTDLKDQVRNARKTIDLTVEYFKLSDKIDENYHNALNQLATVTKDIPNVKTDTAVAAFNDAIDRFVNTNETPQMNQLKQLAQLSHQIYGFDKTVTTFNDHIALYQSFAKLKADIAAIAEQIRLEEEHRQQQLKLHDQLLEQQKQQSLLQQQQQDLLAEKQKLEQQLRLQQQQQQQQKEQLALELQQQREQQEKLLQLQQQQQLQQRQQLEQQLLEQQQHQQQLQAEQQLLQQQLEEQISAAAKAAVVVAQPTTVDETDKHTSSSVVHESLISSSTHTTSQKSESFNEIVYEYPRFVRPLCDSSVQEGDRFTFECIVTGQPQPTVEWFKDGRSINTNTDYKTSFDGAQCSLTIDESIAADSARFTCKATNAAGQSETTALLSVKEPVPLVMLESPSFVRLLQSGVAREGASWEFSCCVAGNPLPTVQWFKNDLCVDHLKDFHITFNNGEALLRLEEVFLEDQAVFTCKATNPYGTEQSSALLTVEPIEPTEKPTIRVPLSNVMARVGQKIKLECTVTGLPRPDLYWTQNGKPFVDRDSKLQYENDRATLLILEAFPKDAGVYVLTARNLAGEAHSTSNVTVKGRLPNETSDSEIPSDMEPIKPTVQLPLKNTAVFEGKSVRLDCVIVGQPEPEVIWYHNDRPVKESQDVQLLFQGDRCTLIVQEAFLEDAGRYRVVAINSAGEAASSCELTVTPLNELDPARRSQIERLLPIAQPPRFDRLLSDILTDEGEQIEFECSVLGDPRSTVKWLLNNREISDADARQQSVYTPEGTVKLVIRNVCQADKGVYTVKASNSCGEAKCFSHLIVKSVNASEMVKREHPSAEAVCPTFRELFTDQSVRIDEPAKFECIVVGKPTPKIRWYFNDQPVQGKHFLVSRSGDRQVLTVPAVSSETVGRIACVAENEVGKATCQAGLGLATTARPETYAEMGEQNFMEEYNTGSSNVTIQKKLYTSTHTSQVNSVENSSTLPQTQIHGYASHSAEQSNQMQEYRQTNDVPVTSHTRSIVNFTKAAPVETVVADFAKVQRKNLAPRFVTPFNGKIVDQGGDVVLEAIVDGYPSPELKITKNGEPLFESGNVSITNKCNKINVELRNVNVSDAGRYSVLATNVAGSSNSTADVVVKKSIFPPVFGHRLQAQVVKRNERVLMDVEVSGTPTPTVAWFKDNIPIKDAMSNEFQIKQSGNNHTLIIGSVKITDAGKYMVKAVNAAGEAQSIADFAVLEPTPDRMVEVVKTVVFDNVQNQQSSEHAQSNPNPSSSSSMHDSQMLSTATAADSHHGMIEETIVTETRRTTEATMRMEHKPQLDIPITHTQDTQTQPIAVHSAATTTGDQPMPPPLVTSATNTDRPPATVAGTTQTPPQTLPKPMPQPQQVNGVQSTEDTTIIDTKSISKHSSLEYFSKIIGQENTNGDVYKKFENIAPTVHAAPPAIAASAATTSADDTAKLHAELAEMNLLPGPPPEMGFAPKPQEPKREQLSERIRKLEEAHKEIADIPSGGVRMLPPVVESPVFPKVAAAAAPKEVLNMNSSFSEHKFESSNSSTVQNQYKYENGSTTTTTTTIPAPVTEPRAASPRPSAQGVAMDRLWTATAKPQPAAEPTKLFDSSVYHTSKNEFAEQYTSSRRQIGTPISESDTDAGPRYESASDAEPAHPSSRPLLRRRNSTKETAKMFENKIRDMDNAPQRHMFDLKAPGLVQQILPRSVAPPAPERPRSVHEVPSQPLGVQLEPGSPPEMCYAPRITTASERKQSLVDAIEQTIEKDHAHGPTKILAGAVRMIPPAMKKPPTVEPKVAQNGVPKAQPQQPLQCETVQRLYESKTFATNKTSAGPVNGNGPAPTVQPVQHQPPKTQPLNGSGYMADSEDTLKRKSHFTSTSESSKSVFESYANYQQQSYSSTTNGIQTQSHQNQAASFAQSHAPQPSFTSHGHPEQFNGGAQKDFTATSKNIAINTKQIKTRLPSPSKFVKSDYKESDYESDLDRKIITPVWRPSTANDSDSEPMYYKPIRPVLSTPSSRPLSQISDTCSPMPPTVFDQPPKFDGPPRPKFQPIEKPKQTSPFPQQQKSAGPAAQTLFKPTPVVPTRPLPQQQQHPQQPGRPQQYYTAVSGPPQHIASETRNQMHMRESSETAHRVINMTQTKRIIQFDATQSNFEQHSGGFPYAGAEPSPVSQQRSGVRQPVQATTTTPTPTKFVPCESRNTNYESDVDAARIRPLWTPNASDSEEPQYRRVNAPMASRSASQPRSNGGAAPVQTPMEFDNKPVELPSKINLSSLQQQQQQQHQKQNQKSQSTRSNNVHKTQTLDRYTSSSSSSTMTTKKTQHISTKQHSSTSQSFVAPKPAFDLQPEAPPEYGYFAEIEQRSPASGMKTSLHTRSQQFMSDVAHDVRRNNGGALDVGQQQQQANGGSPQAYRDESRVSQYGTKHIDPNTGLIYFKYDFGYEFGILFPGEGHKFIAGSGQSAVGPRSVRAKSVPPRNHYLHSSADDISIPVQHERTAQAPSIASGYASESELTQRRHHQLGRSIEINIDALHTNPQTGRASTVQTDNWGQEQQRSTPICTPNFLQEQQPKRPPLFITPLKDIAVVNGSMARFECIVQCDPYPNISWSRNGVPIANNGGRYNIVFRNGVCRLTIPQAFTTDAGQYTCIGTNQLGSVTTTANLIVPSDHWAQRK